MQYLEDFPGCVIVVSHDRYFMDKVVDHLLVFHGDGDVQDFPGNYTQYRDWLRLKPREESAEKPKAKQEPRRAHGSDSKRKLSYKEKRELELLTTDIQSLEAEQKRLETELCSGTLSVADLTEKSRRLPQLKAELDEKEMRWLELSEIEGD